MVWPAAVARLPIGGYAFPGSRRRACIQVEPRVEQSGSTARPAPPNPPAAQTGIFGADCNARSKKREPGCVSDARAGAGKRSISGKRSVRHDCIEPLRSQGSHAGRSNRVTWARTRAMKAARAAELERSRSYCARKNERRRWPHIGFSARISILRPGSPATRRVPPWRAVGRHHPE
jgi:hypothetical protein